jgi:hypothetical protein
LQVELKKTSPFACDEEELTPNLLRTADPIHHRTSRVLREYLFTNPQYNILRITRGKRTPLPEHEMATRTMTKVSCITGPINRLEAAGLFDRKRGNIDQRLIHVGLSKPGEAKLAAID